MIVPVGRGAKNGVQKSGDREGAEIRFRIAQREGLAGLIAEGPTRPWVGVVRRDEHDGPMGASCGPVNRRFCPVEERISTRGSRLDPIGGFCQTSAAIAVRPRFRVPGGRAPRRTTPFAPPPQGRRIVSMPAPRHTAPRSAHRGDASVDSVSVVVPIYNEFENLPHLHAALDAVLSHLGRPYEIVLVDDGSSDGSLERIEELAARDPHVKLVEFRSNFGQTAAMAAGIKYATGDVIVTMDGDLQNDPTDIPMLLAKIDEGYDLVHGWRKNRQDTFVSRKLPSKIANWLISKVTKFPVHDLGCTLKAIRREVAREIPLYGDMHRFIPILGGWRGAKCVEVVTKHHARRFGESKYGISRTFRVLLDLITVKYLVSYLGSPMRLFGAIGLLCGMLGGLAGFATVWMKLANGTDMTGNPLLLLGVFSAMLGVQFVVMGMLGELAARIYYGEADREPFAVRRTVNLDQPLASPPEPIRRAA
jgi:glycosyltransferase involved in cell wall biosynthesis